MYIKTYGPTLILLKLSGIWPKKYPAQPFLHLLHYVVLELLHFKTFKVSLRNDFNNLRQLY